jgi:hypothetical protein
MKKSLPGNGPGRVKNCFNKLLDIFRWRIQRMTDNINGFDNHRSQAGDAAVDGLFYGFQAGLAMALYLLLAALLSGDQPGRTMEWFVFSNAGDMLHAALLHLGVSGIFGTLYGVGLWAAVYRRNVVLTWPIVVLSGLLYSTFLLLFAWFLILPLENSPFPRVPFLHLSAAYLLFGAVLGLFAYRGGLRTRRSRD